MIIKDASIVSTMYKKKEHCNLCQKTHEYTPYINFSFSNDWLNRKRVKKEYFWSELQDMEVEKETPYLEPITWFHTYFKLKEGTGITIANLRFFSWWGLKPILTSDEKMRHLFDCMKPTGTPYFKEIVGFGEINKKIQGLGPETLQQVLETITPPKNIPAFQNPVISEGTIFPISGNR